MYRLRTADNINEEKGETYGEETQLARAKTNRNFVILVLGLLGGAYEKNGGMPVPSPFFILHCNRYP